LINGKWIQSDSSQTIKVENPATGKVIAEVPSLTSSQVAHAVEAAEQALVGWRTRSAKERASILRRWFDLMVANADDLAALMTAEQGKPLAEAKGEALYAASFV
jgi:succinate-semialdehyde dehydrogenase/glutarate-semialdehyde dehydrogenase